MKSILPFLLTIAIIITSILFLGSNGVKSIQITTDEGDSMDDPNAMMSKMIHEIMEDGPPPGGAPVHIQGKIEADP